MAPDVFDEQTRSYVMSQIRSKYTGIDIAMEAILDKSRYAYEMYPVMRGNPDFVLRRRKVAIFCDGEFWHGYRYHEKRRPRTKYWRNKIEGNMRRDRRTSRALRNDGWSVLRFWEHQIKKNPDKCLRRIRLKYAERSS